MKPPEQSLLVEGGWQQFHTRQAAGWRQGLMVIEDGFQHITLKIQWALAPKFTPVATPLVTRYGDQHPGGWVAGSASWPA